MQPSPDTDTCNSRDPLEDLIRAYYDDFNVRRLDAAAARFHSDARIEQITGQTAQGPDGFRRLAAQWLTAFPDGRLTVESVRACGQSMYEVNLTATGTQTGPFAFGSWMFRPSNRCVRLAAREFFQIDGGQFLFTSLSFDVHDLVAQLASVDKDRLLQHVALIRDLGVRLAAEHDPTRERELVERLGRQLDAARHAVRPYFVGNQ